MSSRYIPLLLLCLVGGCGATFKSEARRKISFRLQCPSDEIELERLDSERFRAKGCGRSGTYVCTHRRHLKASGARYLVCERG